MKRSPHHGVLCLLVLIGASAGPALCADPADPAGTNRPAAIPDPSSPPDPSETAPTPGGRSTLTGRDREGAVRSESSEPNGPAPGEPDGPPGAASRSDDAPAEAGPAGGSGSAGDAAPSLSDSEAIPLPPQEALPLGPSRSMDGDAPAAGAGAGSSWVLQTLTALGVVIALILFLRMALVRMGAAPAARNSTGLIEVLARATVAPRTHVLFLRINQRVVVASQTSSGLRPLTELTDPEDVAWLLGRVEADKPTSISRGFSHLMQKFDRDYREPSQPSSKDGSANAHTNTAHTADSADWRIDRTRDELSGLLSRIRNLSRHDEDRPAP